LRRLLFTAAIMAILIIHNASPVQAFTFTAAVSEDYVYVKIISSVSQNVTAFTMGQINVTGESLKTFSLSFDKALKAKAASASIKGLKMMMEISEKWMNVTVEFQVHNISSIKKNVCRVNCAWKSFNVPDDLKFKNVSFNLVGKAYLKPGISRYANVSGVNFYLNETVPVSASYARDLAGNVTLLNFKALSSPLQKWNKTYDPTQHKTIWAVSASPILRLKALVPRFDNITDVYNIYVGPVKAELSAPGYAKADGDTVICNVSKGELEIAMIAVITAILAVSAGVHFIEKRKR
jgi:hypothetical protein